MISIAFFNNYVLSKPYTMKNIIACFFAICLSILTLFAQQSPGVFTIALLPDTQYYTAKKHNGTMKMFQNQIDWIRANAIGQNIAYVVHLGDVSDHGENKLEEWKRAREVMYQLEQPLEGYPEGIPYGVAVGNHDTTPMNTAGAMKDGYPASFGLAHFQGKSYYGGAFNDQPSSENHFSLFSAGGKDFIVIFIGYNEETTKAKKNEELEEKVFKWVGSLLKKHKDRKAIIVSHSLLRRPEGSQSLALPNVGYDGNAKPKFTPQGKAIYEYVKDYKNVFLMLGGHISGEAHRVDLYKGNKIKSILTDYQSRRDAPYGDNNRNGGGGMMRTLTLDIPNNKIHVKSFVPLSATEIVSESDNDSEYVLDLF